MTNKTSYADTLTAILEMNILTDDHKANVEKLLANCQAKVDKSKKKSENLVKENAKLANSIIEKMQSGSKYRTSDLGRLTEETATYSTSKLVSIAKNFDERVEKSIEKGVTYYSLA